MRLPVALCAAALLLGQSNAASACSRVPYAEARISIPSDHLAERMLATAATVDLVVLERIEPWDIDAVFAAELAAAIAQHPEDAGWLAEDFASEAELFRRFGASNVTFRVVERLKGASPDTFPAGAFAVEAGDDGYALIGLVDRIPREGPLPDSASLYDMSGIVDLGAHQGSGSCDSPVVIADEVSILIFRDAQGRILRGAVPAMTHDGRPVAFDGPAFEIVDPAGDVWLDAVRRASGR